MYTKCNFQVTFFDGKSQSSFPPKPAKQTHSFIFFQKIETSPLSPPLRDVYHSKYKLTRDIIHQHLKTYLQKGYPEIQVHQFPEVNPPEFRQHIQTYSAYFSICHNGALRRKNVPSVEPMLKVIANIMESELDVAIINGIKWRDIKVCWRLSAVCFGCVIEDGGLIEGVSDSRS